MIRRIYSTLPKFKTIELKPGFNLLLADKSPGASDKQTRNGTGKSSLLEVMHFLLGADCDKDSLFRSAKFEGATFGMDLEAAGALVNVERSGDEPSVLTVAGDFTRWPVSPTVKGNESKLSNANWKLVLGKSMFNLEELKQAWSPKLRPLLSYFIRRDIGGGMKDPMKQNEKQQMVDQQVHISYLLGLDWRVALGWQQIRDRERSMQALKSGLKDGAFGTIIGSAARLRSERFVAEERAASQRKALESFKVLDEYHALEAEASHNTKLLADLGDENLLDRRYLQELEAHRGQESPPKPEDLEALYAEVGVVLPEAVTKRFEAVEAFHRSVIRNRREYLRAEAIATAARIETRNVEMAKLDTRRAELMTLLRSAGALEHYTALQSELSKVEAVVASLIQKETTAEAIETGSLRLTVDRAELLERLHRDHSEQESAIRRAVVTFRDISKRLYEDEHEGVLAIEPTDDGPRFEARIPSDKSHGVNNMRIFCFDMMLMLVSLQQGRSPGFLVHDSHLFDGVDERQIGRAFAIGASLAAKHGFQYIVTMNSDDLPTTLPRGFSLEQHILPARLTDATEDGGLFGFRFD